MIKELSDRKAELTRHKKALGRQLAKAPEGSLRISHNNDSVLYYHREGISDRRGKYISKDDREIAKALAQKSYVDKALRAIEKEIHAIDSYLKYMPKEPCEDVFETLSEARKCLVEPIWIPDEEFIEDWVSQEYIPKEIADDVPEFYTEKDERVRSKSEVIIANELFRAGVPYRYECPLIIHGVKIHPDFTILNVKKRKEIYWEHFGKMDDPDYANKTVFKKKLYLEGGYYQGDSFICTMESLKYPLSVKDIRKMIEHYCV